MVRGNKRSSVSEASLRGSAALLGRNTDIYVFRNSDLIKKYALKTVNKRLSRMKLLNNARQYSSDRVVALTQAQFRHNNLTIVDMKKGQILREIPRKICPQKAYIEFKSVTQVDFAVCYQLKRNL